MPSHCAHYLFCLLQIKRKIRFRCAIVLYQDPAEFW